MKIVLLTSYSLMLWESSHLEETKPERLLGHSRCAPKQRIRQGEVLEDLSWRLPLFPCQPVGICKASRAKALVSFATLVADVISHWHVLAKACWRAKRGVMKSTGGFPEWKLPECDSQTKQSLVLTPGDHSAKYVNK